MELSEFKTKLDKRDFYADNSKEMWDAAYKWQEISNSQNNICLWSWDCGLKLDYDGDLCRISSRFYPPHKNSESYGKYSGNITVYVGDDEIHKHKVEAFTLDELKKNVEAYVSNIIEKINIKIKSVFT